MSSTVTNIIVCASSMKLGKWGYVGIRRSHYLLLKKYDQVKVSGLLHLFEDFQIYNSQLLCKSNNGYVISGEEVIIRNISECCDSKTRVSIPSLPDESNDNCGAPVSSCFWEWKPKLNVHYEKSGLKNINSPAVLFLPGFGVGSFHYEKQLKDLGRDFRVWAVDFLGQGMSLPYEDPTLFLKKGFCSKDNNILVWGFGNETETWAKELVYSTDLWQNQICSFIKEVIGEPVYVVGNSLGGFVALYIAACNPELVKGVTLLNATPFWGFLPNPVRSPWLARLFPWSGTFPLPAIIRKLIELFWQKIIDPRSIAEILKQVYADHSLKVDKVFSRILKITQHPAAAASFASIMFAPQGQLSFNEALSGCQVNEVPISLMYGKEDPWVRPVWGRLIKKQLPDAPYYEISPAGHCPHDEVPEVVNYLLRGWIENVESCGSVVLPLAKEEGEVMMQDICRELEFVREGRVKLVRVSLLGNATLWDQFTSFINNHIWPS